MHWEDIANLVGRSKRECYDMYKKLKADLGFGLVQNNGGPCGPLAVVQAYVLDYMFREKISDWQNPSENVRSAALRYALCT